MTPEYFPPDDPREWLNRARSNLAQAKACIPDVCFEDRCLNAQQAAEKAVKALLLRHGVDFPYIHNLAKLLRLLEEAGEHIPPDVRQARELTYYAVEARYPGGGEPTGAEECEQAVRVAEAVVR